MAVWKFRKSGGIAALAAGLALMALPGPAAARPDGDGGGEHGQWRGGESAGAPRIEGDANRGGNRGDWQQRSETAPPPMAQPQMAPAPRQEWAQRSGGWQNGGGQAAPQPQASSRWEQRAGSGQGGGGQGSGGQGSGGQGGGWQSRTWQGGGNASPPEIRTEAPRSNWGARNPATVDPARGQQVDRPDPRSANRGRDDWQHGREAWSVANRYGHHDDHWRNDSDRWTGGNPWRGNGMRDERSRQTYAGSYRHWDNNWRRDRDYDWQDYREHNRRVFSIGGYFSPYRNYSYRRLSIGFYLDSLFYSDRYWINDPWTYHLPEAYGPYRWVRYYDDALLVDVYSGEVVDVIEDFFW